MPSQNDKKLTMISVFSLKCQ